MINEDLYTNSEDSNELDTRYFVKYNYEFRGIFDGEVINPECMNLKNYYNLSDISVHDLVFNFIGMSAHETDFQKETLDIKEKSSADVDVIFCTSIKE